MRVFKCFIDHDKEERWLNEMGQKGYELVSVSCGYYFQFTKDEKTVIRTDYRMFKCQADFVEYCTLFEDSGWKHIWGTKYSGTQYFKRMDDNAGEDIFSDSVSKAGKYRRISDMWMNMAVTYIPIFVAFLYSGSIDINQVLNPKQLYLTPGLWEQSGSKFWSQFLFETPFALGRGFMWMIFPMLIAFSFAFSIKSKRLYYKLNKSN